MERNYKAIIFEGALPRHVAPCQSARSETGGDLPDPDRVYRNYLETCLRLGIEPMSRERADELGAEFVAMLTGSPLPPVKR